MGEAGCSKAARAAGRGGLVAVLRRAQARLAFGVPLGAAGAALVFLGTGWGAADFLAAHPYLLLVGAGLLCLLVAAASMPEGLLSFCPPEVQQGLLGTTLFDLLHNDVAVQNFLRRWVRMLLLALPGVARSEGQVAAVLQGLDPEFVDGVFRGALVQHLPGGIRELLLPASRGADAAVVLEASAPDACAAPTLAAGGPAGPREETRPAGHLAPESVVQLLQRMDAERAAKITEPDLGPAALGVLVPWPVGPALQSYGRLAQQCAKVGLAAIAIAATAAAMRWGGWLQWGRAQRVLLWGLHLRGRAADDGRALPAAGAVGALGAGAAVLAVVLSRRLGPLRGVDGGNGGTE